MNDMPSVYHHNNDNKDEIDTGSVNHINPEPTSNTNATEETKLHPDINTYSTVPRTIPVNDPYARTRPSNKHVEETPGDDQVSQQEYLSSSPNVDTQDRLWSEIDVLDDVKRLAAQNAFKTDVDKGFPGKFEPELIKLRTAHAGLLRNIREHHKKLEQARTGDTSAVSPLYKQKSSSVRSGPVVTATEDKFIDDLVTTIRQLRS